MENILAKMPTRPAIVWPLTDICTFTINIGPNGLENVREFAWLHIQNGNPRPMFSSNFVQLALHDSNLACCRARLILSSVGRFP